MSICSPPSGKEKGASVATGTAPHSAWGLRSGPISCSFLPIVTFISRVHGSCLSPTEETGRVYYSVSITQEQQRHLILPAYDRKSRSGQPFSLQGFWRLPNTQEFNQRLLQVPPNPASLLGVCLPLRPLLLVSWPSAQAPGALLQAQPHPCLSPFTPAAPYPRPGTAAWLYFLLCLQLYYKYFGSWGLGLCLEHRKSQISTCE